MNNIALSVSLATAPSNAYSELRERPRALFPLLVLVLTSVALAYWYYSVVDIEWLKTVTYDNNPEVHAMPEAQRAQMMGMMSRNTLMATAVIAGLVFLPVVYLVHSAVLTLAGRITGLTVGFGHWFALVCWSALPALLGTIVSAIFLVIRDSAQVSPMVLQPLSLNELLFQRPVGSTGFALLESLQLPSILSWILMIIGVRTWSRRSWRFSALFILLPILAIYGLWAAVAFR
jgi:hypothetical protein